jgi:acyl-CoA thioester hydrolase
MFNFETSLRVRYAETDKMGYVYYGNYATYFEVARVEALRSLGINYKEMEDDGIMLPVLSYSTKFFKPAYYDEVLKIKLSIKELPKARIHFYFETYNASDVKINTAEVVLVFVDMVRNKPCSAPQELITQLKSFGL